MMFITLCPSNTLSKEAEESYKKAINYRRKHPDAYYNLGNLVTTYTLLCV